MNRRASDPDGADFSGTRIPPSWCQDHENKIEKIEMALYGNGHPESGLVWKVTENTNFIQGVKGYWTLLVTIGMGGALSAIGLLAWQVVKMLFEHGKLR